MKFIFAAVVVALLSISSCQISLNKLESLTLDDLRAFALYGQSIDRKNQGIGIIFGGLEDYINSLSKKQIISIILGFVERNPELENYFAQTSLQSNNKVSNLDKIVKFLEEKDIQTLRDIVVAADELDRSKVQRFGGLSEVVNTLNKGQLILEFVKLAIKNEELQDRTFLEELVTKYIEAIEFSKKFDEVVEPTTAHLSSGINLEELENEDLIVYAVVADEFDRLINPRFGGVAEKAYSMTREELIAFIREKVAAHPKLNDISFLKEIYAQFEERVNFAKNFKNLKAETPKPKFSFDEVFNNLAIEKLRKVAIALDEYDREIHPMRMGGLAEYAARLSKEDLLDIIGESLTKYEELRSISFIESLVEKYAERSEFSEEYNQNVIKSLFKNFSKNELVQIALAVEKIYKKQNNLSPIGGLHDYIWQLDEAGLIKEIVNFSKDVPEALNREFLEELVRKNKAVNVREKIAAQPKETLIKIAIALEAFERDSTNKHFLGGIHDYAERLDSQDLLKFIYNIIDQFPELENIGIIEQILDQYSTEEH